MIRVVRNTLLIKSIQNVLLPYNDFSKKIRQFLWCFEGINGISQELTRKA